MILPAQPVRSEAGGPRRNQAPRVSPEVDGLGTTEPPEPPTPPATSSTKYISHAASRLARPAATAPATAMTPQRRPQRRRRSSGPAHHRGRLAGREWRQGPPPRPHPERRGSVTGEAARRRHNSTSATTGSRASPSLQEPPEFPLAGSGTREAQALVSFAPQIRSVSPSAVNALVHTELGAAGEATREHGAARQERQALGCGPLLVMTYAPTVQRLSLQRVNAHVLRQVNHGRPQLLHKRARARYVDAAVDDEQRVRQAQWRRQGGGRGSVE